MQLVNLRKNISLFDRRSFLLVGDNLDRMMLYLAKIVDLQCSKKVVIIDPKHNNQTFMDLQNPSTELKESYNQLDLEMMISNWNYCPDDRGVVMILNNCFPRRDHENLFLHETELLFRKAAELNLQLIVAVKRFIMPHNYYRFFDFILVQNPKRHLAKMQAHFPVESEEITEIAAIPETEFLFVDNRPDRAEGTLRYYHCKIEELDEDGAILPEVDIDDTCCICLMDYENGEILIECRSCGNYGHQTCLLQWYESNTSCPLCRAGCRLNRKAVYRSVTS